MKIGSSVKTEQIAQVLGNKIHLPRGNVLSAVKFIRADTCGCKRKINTSSWMQTIGERRASIFSRVLSSSRSFSSRVVEFSPAVPPTATRCTLPFGSLAAAEVPRELLRRDLIYFPRALSARTFEQSPRILPRCRYLSVPRTPSRAEFRTAEGDLKSRNPLAHAHVAARNRAALDSLIRFTLRSLSSLITGRFLTV